MQNHYEINVSLNGSHFFATAERSILTEDKLRNVARVFVAKFPKSEGYEISITRWEAGGRGVDLVSAVK